MKNLEQNQRVNGKMSRSEDKANGKQKALRAMFSPKTEACYPFNVKRGSVIW